MAVLDFAALERPASPNTYLVCTPAICQAARSDEEAPVFTADLDKVRAAIESLASKIAWTQTESGLRGSYVATTAIMRFKDDVDVLLLRVNGGTQVCVYSRSRVGYSDLGANRRRVQKLLADLKARLG